MAAIMAAATLSLPLTSCSKADSASSTASGASASGDIEEGVTSGKRAPDFEVELITGEKVKLSDYRGKVVYLNFWATWCGYCVQEMPDMQEMKKTYGDKLVILAVDVGENKGTAQGFIEKHKYGDDFTVGLDDGGYIALQYGVYGLPKSLIINPEGVIMCSRQGVLPKDDMIYFIEEALGNKP